MNIIFVLLTVCSYLLGSVPVSYIVARRYRGIDIREYGSGHVGAGNLRRTISMKVAVPVALYDFFKGIIMLALADYLFRLPVTEQAVVGIAVIIGHNWPIFLRFNGGRGLAASMGVAFYLMPWGIAVFVAIAVFSVPLKSTPLPVIAAMAALPLASWLLHHPVTITIGLLAIFLILVIRRLTAPKSAQSAPVRTIELLTNRLLFDRDIRDGNAWIYRKPSRATLSDKPAGVPKDLEKV
jgi:acyl phosphate:glycerol-3-phosphate acyltransferase